jgi:hypothetical protein
MNNLLIPLLVVNMSVLFLAGVIIFKEKKITKLEK